MSHRFALRVRLLTLLLCLGFIVSACSPAAPTPAAAEPTNPPSAGEASEEAPVQTEQPVEAPAEISGTLRVGIWGSPEDIDTQTSALEAYKSTHPNVDIQYESIPGDFAAAYQNAVASGIPYDVMVPGNWLVQGYAAKGLLLDLTPLMERDGISRDDFYASAFDALSYQDRVYAMPMGLHVEVVYYNKDMFDQAGLAYPKSDWTWDEMIEVADQLTIRDDSGNVTQWGVDIWQSANEWAAYLFQNDTWFMTEDGKCNLTDPKVQEVFQNFYDIIHTHKVQPSVADLQELSRDQMFLQGKLAMLGGAHWMAIRIAEDAPDLNYDVAPLPRLAGKEPASVLNVHGWGIFKETQYPEAAWDLVKYLSTSWPKPQMGLIPASKEAAEGPLFLEDPREPEGVQFFLESASWPKNGVVPNDPNAGAWYASYMDPALQAYIAGTLTWEQVVAETCEKAEVEYNKPVNP